MAPDDEAADEEEEAAEPATASVESAVDEAAVVALLEERGQAKQAEDYEKADEIADTLRSDFNVAVDDKRRTWRIVISYGGYYRIGPQVDEFTTSRWATSSCAAPPTQNQGVPRADALHEELTAMGIVLDTRARTWKVR